MSRGNGSRRGLVVQKYGVSVRDARGMLNICRRIKRSLEGGQRVVVVISALGQDTDSLAELAYRMKGGMPRPAARELAMLMTSGESTAAPLVAIGLQGLGVAAAAFSGLQAGILTTAAYAEARIVEVRPDRLLTTLNEGLVPVVAGYQGATEEREVTTLGRGGGDATAVRLAAELGADVCEIYTRGPGILSADRHVVPEAAVLSHVSYEEALELAAMGLPASQPRAVEIAEQYGVPIHFRSIGRAAEGTMIVGQVPERDRRQVCAVAHQDRIARVRVIGVPDRPGGGADVFEPLRAHGISVDVIAHVASSDLTFMVRDHQLERTIEVIEPAARAVGASVSHDHDLAKISLVGIGMRDRAGVAARMFRTLAEVGVSIDTIATSEIRITCIVERDGHEKAVRALHSAFGLGQA